MKLIAGLGNPGKKFEGTRHNIGFMILDALVFQIQNLKLKNKNCDLKFKNNSKLQSLICICRNSENSNQKTVFAKPQTSMNLSGIALYKLINHFKVILPDLWVIHDDLDLRLGDYKIQFGVGPKLHNGILSIEKELKTKDFWRVRIGVDNRSFVERIPGEKYVLQDFREDEKVKLKEVIEKVIPDLFERVGSCE